VACLTAAAAALIALENTPWHGLGERVTLRGRAVAAAVATAPAIVLGGVYGALKGCMFGAVGGLLSGGMYGGVVGFDAGARVGTGKQGDKDAVAAGKAGADADAKKPAGEKKESEAGSPASSASSSTQVEAASQQSRGEDLMARAKAILKLSPDEQVADAKAELARVSAKGVTAYDVLRVSRDATPEVIARAHKAASMAYHPDRNSSPDATAISQAVNAAVAILSDATRRAAYDAGGAGDVAAADDALAAAASGPTIQIKSSKFASGAAAAGGVLGGLMGLGVGAAGGALLGTFGEAASTVKRVWSAAGRDVSASDVAVGRMRSARAAFASRALKVGHESNRLDVGLDVATGEVRLRCAGLRSALVGVRNALPAPIPARVVDLPALDQLVTFAPSERYIERLSACSVPAHSDAKAFTTSLVRAVASSARASRKEIGIPEPIADDGDGAEAASSGDATGLVGEDTYDAVLERKAAENAAKGPITSGRGLIGHAMTEALEAGRGAASHDNAKHGLVLAVMWEAVSRGRDPKAHGEWIARRFATVSGTRMQDELAPIDDPDSGWNESLGSKRSFEPARAIPYLDVATLPPDGGSAGSRLGTSLKRQGALSAHSPKWIRVGELSFGADGDASAAVSKLPVESLMNAGSVVPGSRIGVRIVVDGAGVSDVASVTGVPVASAIIDCDWTALRERA
jgi:hypothetical protein